MSLQLRHRAQELLRRLVDSMPNTLIHLASQPLLTPKLRGDQWLLPTAMVGAALPDVPWILQRALRQLHQLLAHAPGPQGDPSLGDMRLFFGIQGSLAFCCLLALAVALLTRTPTRSFLVLGWAATLHLFLDSLQIKWGNGVLWFAPFHWKLYRLDLAWPEGRLTDLATMLSIPVLIAFAWVLWRHPPERPLLTARRWQLAASVLVLWLLAPAFFLEPMRSSDAFSIFSLASAPAGQTVELGTATVFERDAQLWVRSLSEQQLLLDFDQAPPSNKETSAGAGSLGPGKLSLKGRLFPSGPVDSANTTQGMPPVLVVSDWHQHRPHRREIFNLLGLGLLAIAIVIQHWRSAAHHPTKGESLLSSSRN